MYEKIQKLKKLIDYYERLHGAMDERERQATKTLGTVMAHKSELEDKARGTIAQVMAENRDIKYIKEAEETINSLAVIYLPKPEIKETQLKAGKGYITQAVQDIRSQRPHKRSYTYGEVIDYIRSRSPEIKRVSSAGIYKAFKAQGFRETKKGFKK